MEHFVHASSTRCHDRNRNRQREQARVFDLIYPRIITAIHTEIVTRHRAADSGIQRACRHAKRDRAWVRDTAWHNGNGTRLDNEREWMRSPIGGVLMCTHTWHITPSIGLMRYCPPSRTCEGLHTLDHLTPPSQARCLCNTLEYAITEPICIFLDNEH